MDIALVLDRLLPAAIYSGSLTDNTEAAFNALSWNDERTKPSWQAILDEWDVYTKLLYLHIWQLIVTTKK